MDSSRNQLALVAVGMWTNELQPPHLTRNPEEQGARKVAVHTGFHVDPKCG
ncbi:hypothetical protein DPMN_144015 [Dreissena polymorpha]|uniref:Uncharacterized protein n=1 Tax=Dreissena polymorpha TaxID=45954 RepID=A0A9D4GK87_DREPO|nr:hypothetical protein DPMN_144015 [Dreissena polymorpha]